MKIVQTFWACNQSNLLEFRAGWFAPEYNLMAWCLSCLQLRKYYDEVVLYADSVTSKMLIDTLKLPYTEVFCGLDKFNKYPDNLYSLPKIDTYSKQGAPFLHVDGDVFIWKPFDEEILRGDLIAQNLEVGTSLYNGLMAELETQLTYFAKDIVDEKTKNKTIFAYNAGIIGGNDLQFFDLYTNEAKKLIGKNIAILPKINISAFNVYFEQHLFYCMSETRNKKVKVLFDHIIADNGYNDFGGLIDVPFDKQYIHLVGQLKRSRGVCAGVAERLRRDYPEYYYRIISLFKTRKTSLKTDYYHFTTKSSEDFLIKRYDKLKSDLQSNKLQVINDNRKQTISITNSDLLIAKNAVLSLKAINKDVLNQRKKTMIINDALSFEQKFASILNSKFVNYSRDYLYARDLVHAQNIEAIFSDKKVIYKKKIVTDVLTELIESKYDWLKFVRKNDEQRSRFLSSNQSLVNVFVSLVPECDPKGYSVMWLDSIDVQLLKLLQRKPKTIENVMKEMKKRFDFSMEEVSTTDFEQFIIGRIKLALQAKSVKAVFNK